MPAVANTSRRWNQLGWLWPDSVFMVVWVHKDDLAREPLSFQIGNCKPIWRRFSSFFCRCNGTKMERDKLNV